MKSIPKQLARAKRYRETHREELRVRNKRRGKQSYESKRAWLQSDRGKMLTIATHQKWLSSEKGKAYTAKVRAWRVSPAGHETARRIRAKARAKHGSHRYRYGLTKAQVASIFEESDGLCALCYTRHAYGIDHDHSTGRIRGALCKPCNSALGILGDDVESLHAAIAYLNQRSCDGPEDRGMILRMQ
jgi:hypothetical protein